MADVRFCGGPSGGRDDGGVRPRGVPLISVWLRDLIISLLISAFIIIFLYQPVKVEGTRMAPLLSDQERIFINKFVYRFEPIDRGDVVVFWTFQMSVTRPFES